MSRRERSIAAHQRKLPLDPNGSVRILSSGLSFAKAKLTGLSPEHSIPVVKPTLRPSGDEFPVAKLMLGPPGDEFPVAKLMLSCRATNFLSQNCWPGSQTVYFLSHN